MNHFDEIHEDAVKDEEEQLYLVCDDTNNDISLDEIDLNTLPPEVLEKMRKIVRDLEERCNVA